MRLIDADRLKEKVLKWLPSDPCGIEEKEHPIETDIVVSLMMEIEEAPTVNGWIPISEKPKEEEKVYLVQLDSGGMCSCRWTNVNPFWTERTTDWHWNIFDIPQYCKVVAWMPEPKLYIPESEE